MKNLIKKNILLLCFLSSALLAYIFFEISHLAISQVIATEPEIINKIEIALTKRYKLDQIEVSIPAYISIQYSKLEDEWKYDIDTKKVKISSVTSNIEVLENKDESILIKAVGYLDQKKAQKILDVSFNKNELRIKEWPEHVSKDVKMQIYLPPSFKKSLEINTVSGRIEIEKNFLDRIKLSSVSGNMSIEQNSVSSIEVETISGNLVIEFAKQHVPYQFKINTLSGEITNAIKDNFKTGKLISIKTVSGNVEID